VNQTELTDCGEKCHCRRQRHDSRSEKSDYYHQTSRCLVPATEHYIAAGAGWLYRQAWGFLTDLKVSGRAFEHSGLLRCYAASCASALKMRATRSFQTSKTQVWRYGDIPQDRNPQSHCCNNLKTLTRWGSVHPFQATFQHPPLVLCPLAVPIRPTHKQAVPFMLSLSMPLCPALRRQTATSTFIVAPCISMIQSLFYTNLCTYIYIYYQSLKYFLHLIAPTCFDTACHHQGAPLSWLKSLVKNKKLKIIRS
jgi:hypothetical protein